MFDKEHVITINHYKAAEHPFISLLLKGDGAGTLFQTSTEGVPPEFVVEFVHRFENDGLDEICAPLFTALSAEMNTRNLTNNFLAPLMVHFFILSIDP